LATPALQIAANRICSNSERGLLGVAVDPQFATNQYIYLYYTFRRPGGDCGQRTATTPVNRVSRFVLPASKVIDPATETVLIDNIPSYNGNHNGGDVQFGRDGYLYVSVGDSGCDPVGDSGCAGANDAARDVNTLSGKVLRITKDGGIPAENPWQGAGTARCGSASNGATPGGSAAAGVRCQEVFAWGLRNPFRLAFDPNAAETRFFILDVGQDVWEEINEAKAGAD
jgi:glucose/arabinose dehydrogenase